MFNTKSGSKIILFVVSSTLCPLAAHADQQISLGLGKPYGGFLGGKYSVNLQNMKIYAGAGFLGHSHSSGSSLGYSVGFEYQIAAPKHSAGISYGTVHDSYTNSEYVGPSINYTYYFSGFNEKSWLLGLSGFQGEIDTTYQGYEYKDTKKGLFIIIGFQF